MRYDHRLRRSHDRHPGHHGVLAGFACAGLSRRLTALRDEVERRWPLSLAIDIVDPIGIGALSPSLADEIYGFAQEAALNAARHAHAARLSIRLQLGRGAALLTVEDDGQGFPFAGTYGLRELIALGTGPRWLLSHVEALGGALTLQSRPGGSRIEIALPFGAPPVGVPSVTTH